jgi:hypothetical protein
MNPSKTPPWNFWSGENGMTGLLIFSLLYLFAICALGDLTFGDFITGGLLSLVILAGVLTTFRERWVRFYAIVLALACLTVNWLARARPDETLTLLKVGLNCIYLAFLLVALTIQVFRAGPVTGHRIRGAVVIYVLMGGIWSLLYQFVALSLPGAFHFPESLAAGDADALQRMLTYFSFATLTTTGFGDVTPALPLTRTLAMFEALTGQLYLVIILTRLVSLAIMNPERKA